MKVRARMTAEFRRGIIVSDKARRRRQPGWRFLRPRGSAGPKAVALALLAIPGMSCDQGEHAPSAAQERPAIWGHLFSLELVLGDVSFLRHVSPDHRIELIVTENVRPDVAETMILERVSMFESTFQRGRTGYPGQHTRYIDFPERFKPKRFEESLSCGYVTYFTAFANSNFVHGASTEDLAIYRSLHGFLYCNDRRTLIELDYFTGIDHEERIDRFVAGVSCDIDRE